MQLWVGLGNPGQKYRENRHNIGFMALDRIGAEHGFGPWKGRFQAEISEGRLGGEKVLLLKPQTFMNLSGQAVGEAMRYHKLEPAAVTVFHDELDLAPGKCRLKQGGGHAGHNGLRSIIGHIGEGFGRVRLGIGHPGRKELVAQYVLHDFAKADADWLDDLMRGIADGATWLAQGDGGKFQNAVAARVAPARNSGNAPAAKKGPQPDRASAAQPSRSAPEPASQPAPEARPDTRSPLQKLIERFR